MEHISELIRKQETGIQKKPKTKHWQTVQSLPVALTAQEAVKQNAPTMLQLMREDEKAAHTLMTGKIVELQQMLDVKNQMEVGEAHQASRMLCANWTQLTSADIHACFSMIASGKLGKDYHRFDAHTIGNFFQAYIEQRPGKIMKGSIFNTEI